MASSLRPFTGANWADADDDDDEEVVDSGAFQTAPDAQGIKVAVEYIERDSKTYKICRRVKQTKTQKWTNAGIAARREMPKFGKAAIENSEHGNMRMRSEEDVFIELSKKNAAIAVTNDAEDKFLEESLNICEGLMKEKKSWADAQKEKAQTELDGPVGGEAPATAAAPAAATAAAAPSAAGPGGANAPGRYVPPSLRTGAGTGKGDGKGKQGDGQEASLRITNLSDFAKEGDLQDLFGQFGRLQRVFLSKDMQTGLSKGFAFITYYNREDAQKAMNRLNGHGYDNLILQVQWAKPRA